MACTWDPTKVGSNITLSNGNLTWTSTSASERGGIGTVGYKADLPFRLYFEVTAATANNLGCGICNQNYTFGTTFAGGDSGNALAYYSNDIVVYDDSVSATYAAYTTATVGVATDFVHQKLWWTIDGTTWNHDVIGNQNPALNVGGFNGVFVPTFWGTSGAYKTMYPVFGSRANGNIATANFGASSFAYAMPTGFSPWDAPFDPSRMFFLLAP